MKLVRPFSLFFTLALMFVLIGCSDDTTKPAPVIDTQAETVEELMAFFVASYADMDGAKYRDLLDSRFHFFYTDGEDHDYDAEQRIIGNIFSGNPPTNPPPYSWHQGIRSIEFDMLRIQGAWAPVDVAHADFGSIPGAMRGYFEIFVIFHHDAGTITISSGQLFYAVPVERLVGGATITEWKLLGQEDVAVKASDEDLSWSELKSLFR